MDIEAKLDDDFLFYMNFINTFLKRISDHDVFRMCRNWIFKLCTEPCEGIDKKRCRNMYLANLLICMHTGKLEEPFLQPPFYVDISDALKIFGSIPDSVEKPSWLNDTDLVLEPQHHQEKKGRTYFATRTLPNGQGAFAYIGINLTDEWMGPSAGAGDRSMERKAAVEQQFGQKFAEEIPQYELEKILAKRKDPKEREKVLTFYDTLLNIVADELNGKAPEYNETIEGLLEQLVEDLTQKDQYVCCYEGLDEYQKRMELLMTLFDRIKIRRDKVARREEILDDIEQKVMPHLFEVSAIEPDDEYQLPAAMWQQAIDKMPNKKAMEKLKSTYPIPVVENFIILLAAFKEEIAERMHRRHEKIATQMKKELKKESLKKKKEAEKIETICHETEEIYKAVKDHWQKKQDLLKQNREQFDVPLSDHSRFYENLKKTALDTQKLVEEEAARGKFLASQINAVANESLEINEVNEDSIQKCEIANTKILRNIKRLNTIIKVYETRVEDIKSMAEQSKKKVEGLLSGLEDEDD